jgi:hypothetical protein
MPLSRSLVPATVLLLTACDGLKEALTAHVDVVASAASQELSVQRLADMMGKSQVPVRKEVAQQIADAWINYQLIGKSVIDGDSLNDRKLVDDVMWPVFTGSKTQKLYERVSATWLPDTTNLEQKYAAGDLLAARHILFQVPQGQSPTGSDTSLKRAQEVLAKTTSANFAAMAKQYGSDGTKDVGGDLGVFAPGQMVAEFSAGVKALKPGEIGPLVRTQFGYHIVRRSTYDEVKDAFKQQLIGRQRQIAESTFIANTENSAKIELKPTLARTVKAVAADPSGHLDDRTVVATYRRGNFTAGDVARWMMGFPNADQMRAQIAQAPDSIMPLVVRNMLRNELFLAAADSAKITLDSLEVENIHKSFATLVQSAWAGLRIAPSMIQDSAKTKDERARYVPSHIDTYLDNLVKGSEQYVEVPSPLAQAVRRKYDWKVSAAGVDRAIAAATTIRAKEDSARAAAMPQSAVPMPGAPPADTGRRK